MRELNRHYINRLTALWAFSESGLGGMMHAFKIPFTGFFLGGFAIVIITLIAHHSNKRFTDILQSTLLVILVKAAASPHSPVMAYLAVAFQGICGAVIYAMGKNHFSAALFGALALFESAIQKFITATLIFGKNIWEALDLFVLGITKDLHLNSDFSFSLWLIALYTGVYTIWGLILGIWASRVPAKMQIEASALTERMKQYRNIGQTESPMLKTRRRKYWRMLSLFFILLFIVTVFITTNNTRDAGYTVIRTLAAIFVIYFFLSPLTRILFQRWLKNKRTGNTHKIKGILDAMPQLKSLTAPAMHFAKSDAAGIFIYPKFVFNLIVLALYYYED
jgi:uncharacterized membrane protein YhaH (DUF805 family)